jgi:hypothetical protein
MKVGLKSLSKSFERQSGLGERYASAELSGAYAQRGGWLLTSYRRSRQTGSLPILMTLHG